MFELVSCATKVCANTVDAVAKQNVSIAGQHVNLPAR